MSATDFDTRARELVERIEHDGLDDEIAGAIEQLRERWRTLSTSERDESAAAARALADAQARAVRRYDGPRDPDALLAHFGLPSFRPGQREAVQAALDRRDSLIVMPTGGGKSLCYQLPAIADDDLTVVVSPLIALMHDQHRRLALGGHPAVMIASGLEQGPRPARSHGSATAPPGSCSARRSGSRRRPFSRRSNGGASACSSSTRPTACPNGGMTSGPTTCACAG